MSRIFKNTITMLDKMDNVVIYYICSNQYVTDTYGFIEFYLNHKKYTLWVYRDVSMYGRYVFDKNTIFMHIFSGNNRKNLIKAINNEIINGKIV